jgi:hypothetical protein
VFVILLVLTPSEENPWFVRELLGVSLSLMARTAMEKISDGKEQRWKEQRNREVTKLQGGQIRDM